MPVEPDAIRAFGQCIQVVDVGMYSVDWNNRVQPRLLPPDALHRIDFRWRVQRLEWNRLDELFFYAFTTVVDGYVRFEDGMLPAFEGSVVTHGLFKFADDEARETSDEVIEAYIKSTGFAATMPFSRQQFATLSAAAGWQAVMLPLCYAAPPELVAERIPDRKAESDSADEESLEHVE